MEQLDIMNGPKVTKDITLGSVLLALPIITAIMGGAAYLQKINDSVQALTSEMHMTTQQLQVNATNNVRDLSNALKEAEHRREEENIRLQGEFDWLRNQVIQQEGPRRRGDLVPGLQFKPPPEPEPSGNSHG